MLIEAHVVTREAIVPRGMSRIRFTLFWNELFLTQSVKGWVVGLGKGKVSSVALGGRPRPVKA